ncbi:hypothetical protein BDZ91DRAFT_756850 [Kalaharituber pfeilii]|nr:hypothetical protein BDZ91DRAFT_756850 [Kalaharituber pfeilii]
MLEESWGIAQDRLGEYKVKIKAIDSHLKSIYLRVRSQLVYECRDTVMNLYGLNHLSAEAKATKVKELLLHNHCVCEGKYRMRMENWFMAEEIIDVIWHCLKAWSLRTFNQNSVEFKFESAFSIYDHLIKAWEDHSDQVQDLIVVNVKAEVKDWLLRKTRPVDQEMVVYSVPTTTRQATPAQSDTSTEQDAQCQD